MARHNSIAEAVGGRLRDLRRSRGLTMVAVADASSGRWKTSSIGNYERGTRGVSLEALEWFAQLYGVPLSYLLDGEPEPAQGTSGRLTIRLRPLDGNTAAAPVAQIAAQIAAWRRIPAPDQITVRNGDASLFAAALGLTTAATLRRLSEWGAIDLD